MEGQSEDLSNEVQFEKKPIISLSELKRFIGEDEQSENYRTFLDYIESGTNQGIIQRTKDNLFDAIEGGKIIDMSSDFDLKILITTDDIELYIQILSKNIDTLFEKSNDGFIISESTQIALKNCIEYLENHDREKFKNFIKKGKNVLSKLRKKEIEQNHFVDFDELTIGLSREQIINFGKTIAVIQFTSGCSIGCPQCNFRSVKDVRIKLSWSAINEIVDLYRDSIIKNEPFLYYSSDPLDWEDEEGRNYLDVQNLFYEKCGYYPHITTAIPKGKEELFRRIWQSNVYVRVSITSINRKRLSLSEGKTIKDVFGEPGNKQSFSLIHDFEIKSRPELGESLQGSIACRNGGLITPEGLFSMISTPTSLVTPTGYIKLKVTSTINNFIGFGISNQNYWNYLGNFTEEQLYIMFSRFSIPITTFSLINDEDDLLHIRYSPLSNDTLFRLNISDNFSGNKRKYGIEQKFSIQIFRKYIEMYRKFFNENPKYKRLLYMEHYEKMRKELSDKEEITEEKLIEALNNKNSRKRQEIRYFYLMQEMFKLLCS